MTSAHGAISVTQHFPHALWGLLAFALVTAAFGIYGIKRKGLGWNSSFAAVSFGGALALFLLPRLVMPAHGWAWVYWATLVVMVVGFIIGICYAVFGDKPVMNSSVRTERNS